MRWRRQDLDAAKAIPRRSRTASETPWPRTAIGSPTPPPRLGDAVAEYCALLRPRVTRAPASMNGRSGWDDVYRALIERSRKPV